MGYDLEGEDKTVFDEILASDSTLHFYRNVRVGENWCYYHHQYENVEVK